MRLTELCYITGTSVTGTLPWNEKNWFMMNLELEDPGEISHLEIFSLGGLQILSNGRPVPGLTSKPAQALLVYLAYQGQEVSRQALAELLWENRPLEQALGNLRITLLRLRKIFPKILEIQRDRVGLKANEQKWWFDVQEFQSQFDRGDYVRAVDLYRGEFLRSFSLPGSRAFEDWQFAESECLLNEALFACQQHIRKLCDLNEFDQAISFCRRLLLLDPYHEPGYRQLIRLLAENGQRLAAIQQYQVFCDLLEKEINSEPDPLTVEVYRQILNNTQEGKTGIDVEADRQASLFSVSHLPLPAMPMVGRQEELAYITSRLSSPDCRLLTILGPGGIGKTRLALEAAWEQLEKFIDGVYFISLVGVNTPSRILPAIAQALGFQATPTADPDQQLLFSLKRKQLLLVLDNFEQLVQAAIPESSAPGFPSGNHVVEGLLQNSPGLKLLVTSRIRLNLLEEWRLPLHGLASESPAVSLFVQFASRLKPDFSLAGQEKIVQEICDLLAGIPLAIELAAAWVPMFSCTQIAEKILENLDFLTSDLHNLPDRHRSIRALFKYSWGMLNFEEKNTLSRLAIFPSDGAIEQILDVTGTEVRILRNLVEKSLVQVKQDGRYALHELVRQYALEKLNAAGDVEETQLRHFQVFLKLAEMADTKMRGSEQETWWLRLESESENFDAALDWAFYHQTDTRLPANLVIALGWFWRIRSHIYEARRWQEEALRLSGLQREQVAFLLRLAGSTDWLQGEFDLARQRLSTSLELWKACGPAGRSGHAYALHFLGMTHYQQDHKETAMELFIESAMIFFDLQDEWGYAFSKGWLGKVAEDLGDANLAITATRECLTIMRRLGDRWGLALFLSNEAWRLLRSGEMKLARQSAEESLGLRARLGHTHSLAEAYSLLGEIERREGDLEKAKEYFRQSLNLYESLGNQRYVDNLRLILLESGTSPEDH